MAAVTLLLLASGAFCGGAIVMAFIAGGVVRAAEADLQAERAAHAQTARLWVAVPAQIRSVVRSQLAGRDREQVERGGVR